MHGGVKHFRVASKWVTASFTREECHPWPCQKGLCLRNRWVASVSGPGRCPDCCWPNRKRPTAPPCGRNGSCLRWMPPTCLPESPDFHASKRPAWKSSLRLWLSIRRTAVFIQINIDHQLKHKSYMQITDSNSSKDSRPLPAPDWSRSYSSIIWRTFHCGILNPHTSNADFSSAKSMNPEPSRSICKKNKIKIFKSFQHHKLCFSIIVNLNITKPNFLLGRGKTENFSRYLFKRKDYPQNLQHFRFPCLKLNRIKKIAILKM